MNPPPRPPPDLTRRPNIREDIPIDDDPLWSRSARRLRWLPWRLDYLCDTRINVHYESSFMGPHNEFLHAYFPACDGWMIKPIPRLRKMLKLPTPDLGVHGDAETRPDSDLSDEHMDADSSMESDQSKDSYGQGVETRKGDPTPDYLVCKASPDPRFEGDKPVLIWELKRDGREYGESSVQVSRYEDWLREYREISDNRGDEVPTLWLALVEKRSLSVTQLARDRNFAPQTVSEDLLGLAAHTALLTVAEDMIANVVDTSDSDSM
ncbi:hypothetical protein K438DRAFT_1870455 [Mycena galopus ATCC 62051]|nr:hypothetical protein K438DRAFT_1870455 [Mycena galopus ATCC 62051]